MVAARKATKRYKKGNRVQFSVENFGWDDDYVKPMQETIGLAGLQLLLEAKTFF